MDYGWPRFCQMGGCSHLVNHQIYACGIFYVCDCCKDQLDDMGYQIPGKD